MINFKCCFLSEKLDRFSGGFSTFGAGVLAVLAFGNAWAAPLEGAAYAAVSEAAPDQAQVIIFRSGKQQSAPQGPAHVYVDSQLHAALLSNGYSRICLKPGLHSLEAYVADAPLFTGKFSPTTQVRLEAGKTYFVAVSDDGSGELRPYQRVGAERLLAGATANNYVVNRARSVVPCSEVSDEAPTDAATKPAAAVTSYDIASS